MNACLEVSLPRCARPQDGKILDRRAAPTDRDSEAPSRQVPGGGWIINGQDPQGSHVLSAKQQGIVSLGWTHTFQYLSSFGIKRIAVSWKAVPHNANGSGSCIFVDMSRRGTGIRQR